MFARVFIDRPVLAWVVSIVVLLFGAAAYTQLPIEQFPAIAPPTVQVTATYPGANAEVVAKTVAATIEQEVNGVEGMLYMSSQSTNDGRYTLTVTFEIGTDLNFAQVLVQNRVQLAVPRLPSEVQRLGLGVKKRAPDVLLVVNMVSPDRTRDAFYLSNYATIQVKDVLIRTAGVGDVFIFGQQDYSMRAWLGPDKMASNGLTAPEVVEAMRNQNVQVAAGQVGQEPAPPGTAFQYTMTALGRLETVEQFEDIVVKVGAPQQDPTGQTIRPAVRLKDVARVQLTSQSRDISSSTDGQDAVGLAIFQLPGSNALDTADNVKHAMEQLKKRFPPGVDYTVRYDTTPFIIQSVDEVFHTLRDAIILVALVVLLFLQDWRAMILPMIDVPVSLVGTLAVMYVAGFTLNNLTLFGLVLAIGIVVDDAIVVLENVERWIAQGYDSRTATIKAMQEITGPIIAITLVLSSVFLPSALAARHHRRVLPPVRADDLGRHADFRNERDDADPQPRGGDLQEPRRRTRPRDDRDPALVRLGRAHRLRHLFTRARFSRPQTRRPPRVAVVRRHDYTGPARVRSRLFSSPARSIQFCASFTARSTGSSTKLHSATAAPCGCSSGPPSAC